jgi:type II secretory pathway pseudopilin PulG
MNAAAFHSTVKKRSLRPAGAPSFSLVEVVVALGVVSFALLTMLGLLSLGLTTNKLSSDHIQAANLASLLVATRRASPSDPTNGTYLASFALPHLDQPYVTNTTVVGLDGTTSTNTGTTYNLFYGVGTSPGTTNLAHVYLLLWWPVGAPKPVNNPSSYYELSTTVSLQ